MTHAKHLTTALFAVIAAAAVPAAMVSTVAAQPASTDPKERAKAAYLEGRKLYDLGNFKEAVEKFKKAYEEWPDGAFLFNIAQSYRQLDDCKQALFFYKRFLSVKKDATDTVRKEVEGHIKVLDECVKRQDDIRNRQPDGTNPPDIGDGGTGGTGTGGTGTGGTGTGGTGTGGTGTGGTGTGGTGGTGDRVADGTGGGDTDEGEGEGEGEDDGVTKTTTQPSLIAAHANVGGAMVGAGDLEIPVQVAITVTAGYPIAINEKLVLDAGVGFGFTPVPWSAGAVDGTASMTMLFANAGGTLEVAPKISVRGELGAGLLLLGGLDMGNPFTVGGAPTTGALSMPLVRVGLTGEYAINDNLAASLTPFGFSYSPSKEGIKDEISGLTRIEFTVGLGYRM